MSVSLSLSPVPGPWSPWRPWSQWPLTSESDLFMPACALSLQARRWRGEGEREEGRERTAAMLMMSSEHVDVGRREKQDYILNDGRGRM